MVSRRRARHQIAIDQMQHPARPVQPMNDPPTVQSIIASQAATIAELQAVIKQFSQESAMSSRFDQSAATREEDSALAPEPDDDRDTAESDANDVLSALASFQSQMEQCQDFERLMRLWALFRELYLAAAAVNLAAAKLADVSLARRR